MSHRLVITAHRDDLWFEIACSCGAGSKPLNVRQAREEHGASWDAIEAGVSRRAASWHAAHLAQEAEIDRAYMHRHELRKAAIR